jgi:hypothetical protein
LYNPLSLPASGEIKDTLSEKDIPTGQGGFARDYKVELNAGDQVAIDVTSDSFDTTVSLLSSTGAVLGENDDTSDSTQENNTNSLLFVRIKTNDTYTIRVQSFSKATGGEFNLKLTRLRPVK